MEVAVKRMDEEARAIRMLPFVQVFQGLERAVRDLAASAAKEVEVGMEGGEVEMDRAILEGLRNPLLQLVRNAVDHGIEPPDARRAAGKPGCGRIAVSAGLRGASVEITVSDDGRGLDLAAIRAQAEKRGIPVPKDERELFRLIFLPGFTTARMITEVSGRGVGLDIARTQLEALHGSLEVSSVFGRGCKFTMEVPLTLTTVRALMMTAGGRPFAVPLSGVKRLLRADPGEFRQVEGRQVLMVDGAPVTAARLADLLNIPPDERRRPAGKMPLVVLAAGERLLAVVVDELLEEREILVKNPGPRLSNLKTILGVTVLPDGGTALILSPGELIRVGSTTKGNRSVVPEAESKRRKRLLVADDSLTTRSLEKSILEGAGFEVATVRDGMEAWESLKNREVDLLVSDCDMPRMNGFDLTKAVRGSKRFRDLPVILLTGMESDADKARGLEAGANAYLLKSGFDQKALVETIRQLL
jgi:two-component system chemotaxis sensor kinase CheA